MCVHIGLYVITVCHVPYIYMPCMPGPIMNLTAFESVKSVPLINGLSWSFKVNWRTQFDRYYIVQQLSCERLQEYILYVTDHEYMELLHDLSDIYEKLIWNILHGLDNCANSLR